VVFLCHRSKDPLILDEILANADALFAEFAEADLVKDTTFTGKMVSKIEPPLLQDTDPEKNRLRELERRDKMRKLPENEEDKYAPEISDGEDGKDPQDEEVRGLSAKLNAAIKTIQIAGQILRNFGGRLDGPAKIRLTDACYSLGLRLMKFLLDTFEKSEADIVESAKTTLMEGPRKTSPEEAQERANMLLYGLLRLSAIGLIRITANSVGLEKLSPVFAAVLRDKNTVSRRIIDLSVRMGHFTEFPADQTLNLYKEVKDSFIALDVLRRLVFDRFYFFTAPYNIKQMICKKLEITLQPVLLDRDQKRDV
jgi:hypothetical protein